MYCVDARRTRNSVRVQKRKYPANVSLPSRTANVRFVPKGDPKGDIVGRYRFETKSQLGVPCYSGASSSPIRCLAARSFSKISS